MAGAIADRARVATILAAAFADDPVFEWFFPDRTQRRTCLPKLFARLYEVEMRYGAVVRAEDYQATSFWRAPGQAITPASAFIRQIPALVGLFGLRLGRLMAVSRAIEAHMPDGQPFWYAHFVGVQPAEQRHGWGRAMMQHGFARAAAADMPLYLETARPENVAFYRALGFEVTGEWNVPDGPHFWSLMRWPEIRPLPASPAQPGP